MPWPAPLTTTLPFSAISAAVPARTNPLRSPIIANLTSRRGQSPFPTTISRDPAAVTVAWDTQHLRWFGRPTRVAPRGRKMGQSTDWPPNPQSTRPSMIDGRHFGNAGLGFALIAIGGLLLFQRLTGFNVWHYLWPFFIIVPGLIFF